MPSITFMPWLLLALTVVIEVASTTSLKMSEGLTRPIWFAAAIAGYTVCFVLLSRIFLTIPMGVAYAVWAGAGTALIALVGAVFFGEALTPLRLLFIAMILVGIVGLKLAD